MKVVFVEATHAPSKTHLALALAVVISLFSSGGVSAFTARPLPPLTNLPAIRLEVDGPINPSAVLPVSIAELTQAARRELEAAGIVVKGSSGSEVPVLRVGVLSPHTASQYFYTITVDLEERCRIERLGDADISSCKAWSLDPRVGLFVKGEEAKLTNAVLDAVKLFVGFWSSDNKRPDV